MVVQDISSVDISFFSASFNCAFLSQQSFPSPDGFNRCSKCCKGGFECTAWYVLHFSANIMLLLQIKQLKCCRLRAVHGQGLSCPSVLRTSKPSAPVLGACFFIEPFPVAYSAPRCPVKELQPLPASALPLQVDVRLQTTSGGSIGAL